MKSLIIVLLPILLASCSSVKKTRYNDKNMRVMVNPENIQSMDYASIQSSLVQSNMWTVLDRSAGIRAIKKEQEELHVNSPKRYNDMEKFAHWGKLYGVGAIIVANSECQNRPNTWNVTELKNYCNLYLSLIDANTGEVIASVNDEQSANFMQRPNWKEAVEKLTEIYPEIKKQKVEDKLFKYKVESLNNATLVSKEDN